MTKFLRDAIGSDPDWADLLYKWLGISLVLHLLTAWFSIGYHSADEQFQILEFLAFKLGKVPMQHLAVEYGERMRPWLQPGIYFVMTKFLGVFGVQDPFFLSFTFRLFNGLLGWMSVVGLALCCRFWFEEVRARNFALLALALLWCLPVLHVRPSSESLGASGFLLGFSIAFLTWKIRPTSAWLWALAGFSMGVGFEGRFQVGVMIFGAAIWFLAIARIPLRAAVLTALGLAVAFGIGRAVDAWAYGEWVMSPWRYVQYNLIRGEVHRYGQEPWYDVFRMSFTESWPFIGLALAASCLVAWYRHPLHPLTFATVPFFLVHEAIRHKELRFFFPIAMAGPVLLVLCAYSSKTRRLLELKYPAWKALAGFLLINNFLALIFLTFLPFSRVVQFYRGVWRNIPEGAKEYRLHVKNRDPFEVLGTPIYFYRPPALRIVRIADYSDLATLVENTGKPHMLFHESFRLPEDAKRLAPYCTAVYRTLPLWLESLNFTGWLERANAWTLYECVKPPRSG